eukprot:TRINITY_DN15509_c0_g1_i1.p1 TRINITY_DN15509_c0_g1~~TRINITY_DN15509_c0_g1_i1.p1  ORF type:complete len:163 (-),score=29.30 TRINITY_DN15509_c0_g1_i1:141-629(-)
MGAEQSCCSGDSSANGNVQTITATTATTPAPSTTEDAPSKNDKELAPTVSSPAAADPLPAPKDPLPAPRAGENSTACVLLFEKPDKSTQEVIFTARPLGVDFSRSVPLVVKRVKQEGLAYGQVEEGWVLKCIRQEPVKDKFDEALNQLKEVVSNLPEVQVTR